MWDTAGEVRANSSDVLLWTHSHGRESVGQPARTYLQELYTDTGFNLEDLPETMDYRESGKSVLASRHDDSFK